METITVNLIPQQSALYFADLMTYRTLVGVAGEQGGKSFVGSLWLHHLIDLWAGRGANFVVGAPTYKVLEQSTRPTFMKLGTKYLGSYNGQDDLFKLHKGGAVYFRSGTDPDSVIGIPDCAGGWLDEGGKCSLGFFQNIQGRVARLKGPVMVTSTPYANNWLAKLCKEAEDGTRRDILYRRWRSVDNPSYPKEEYDRLRQILPAHVFKMRLEGMHDKAVGLIFPDWDDNNLADSAAVSLRNAIYIGGIDWGHNHPFAISVRAVTPDGKCYGVSFFKGSGLTVGQQIDLIEAKHRQFSVREWRCGHDRPEMITELGVRHVPAVKYFEGMENYREVAPGNQKLAELIKTKRYRVIRGTQYLADLEDEYATYHYELNADGEQRDKPEALNDDLISAERYCTIGTLPYLTTKADKLEVPLGYWQNKDLWKPNGTKGQHSSDYY